MKTSDGAETVGGEDSSQIDSDMAEQQEQKTRENGGGTFRRSVPLWVDSPSTGIAAGAVPPDAPNSCRFERLHSGPCSFLL